MHFPSQPQWGVLTAQAGPTHLFIADAQGAKAILDLAQPLPTNWFNRADIVYIPKETGTRFTSFLQQLQPRRLHIAASLDSAVPRLCKMLDDAHMGLSVYLAGSECLLAHAMQIAIKEGCDPSALQTEHRGSNTRRVQCVHCKGISDEVRTQPFQCHHCGLWLLVRDHFSRRIGAYQGVNINAEDPHLTPKDIQEVFV